MTTMQKLASLIDFKTKRRINASVRETLASLENENTLIAESPNVLFQRVLSVFGGLKPMLAFLTTFPILPPTWRKGLTAFVQALDALAVFGPQVTVHFKAGKDL
ncbi:MAG TPA: hypothetical protein VF432_11365 [Thermoanaerobaculia bacterium]